MLMPLLHRFRIFAALLLLGFGGAAQAMPCLIFVHGKSTNTGTFTSYTTARNYWVNGSADFVRTATRNLTVPYYVVGYNGTQRYYENNAAGEVAREIVAATNGVADGGGRRCATTFANGGTFVVVAHSMGGTVMDYILGNNDASDPNFNFGGAPFSTVAARVSYVITTGGAHRGSQGADAVCGQSSGGCNFAASFIQSCDDATYWLRSGEDVQVRNFANAPARLIYLTGGYEAIFGASVCLSGEDDGVVQYASQYACGGSAGASYDNSNVCRNNAKQETSGFRNLDAAHENHSDERDDSDSDVRRSIPDGNWQCNGVACAPNTQVQSSMTTARYISTLY